MFALTAAIPWRLLGMLAIVAVAGVQTVRLERERTAHAETRAEQARTHADWQREARVATDAARKEERRVAAEYQEIANETQAKLDGVQADAVRARHERDGLRAQLAALKSSGSRGAPGNPFAAPECAPVTAAVGLLADVLASADDVAAELAEALDRSHTAGLACERAHDTLTKAGKLSP